MAQQNITIGTADAKAGDTLFSAFTKTEANFTELFAVSTLTKRVVVNGISDLPAAVGGVITLAANTLYVQADNVDFSTSRLVFGVNTVYSGLDSLIVTASYTGTSPFFTITSTSGSVKNLKITHPNSPLFSFSDSGSNVLRVSDVQFTGASIGNFGGTNSGLRLTNFSGSNTVTGMSFTGNWAAFLFEPTLSSISVGAFIDLGTATFDSISISETTLSYVAGTFYITGLSNSGNINAGGLASITSSRLSGGGTPLQNITPDDRLFVFDTNNTIRDTRVDGLLSIQGNATATTITTINTPVLAAGVWVVGQLGQFNGTTGGRLTYVGSKDARLPATLLAAIEPASGTNISMSAYVAINGIIVAQSRGQTVASSGAPRSITLPWQVTFAQNDYVEVFLENNTNTNDIIISSGISRVN
jgi:hypothetical protein